MEDTYGSNSNNQQKHTYLRDGSNKPNSPDHNEHTYLRNGHKVNSTNQMEHFEKHLLQFQHQLNTFQDKLSNVEHDIKSVLTLLNNVELISNDTITKNTRYHDNQENWEQHPANHSLTEWYEVNPIDQNHRS